MVELDDLSRDACPYDVKGGPEHSHGKVAILLQVLLPVCGPLAQVWGCV